jgi:putative redox protein
LNDNATIFLLPIERGKTRRKAKILILHSPQTTLAMNAPIEHGMMKSSQNRKKEEKQADEPYPISVNWVEKMQFIGRDDRGHSVVMDTSPAGGGENSGPSPARLLLMAVACCTAMDVVDILKKSRQELTGLSVLSRGVQNEEYPKYFKEIHLKYILEGKDLAKDRVERAIELSEEKYCSVGATVSGRAKILTEYEILDLK